MHARFAAGSAVAEFGVDDDIGETTVKTHVSRIFTKLGLRDRAQPVVIAYETGLVEPGAPSTTDGA